MHKKTAVLALALTMAMPAFAAGRPIINLTLPGPDGKPVTKPATKVLLPSDGIKPVCGTPLYYGGIAEDGVRTLNCDGTGTYVDGKNTGNFTWYYAVSETDKTKLKIKSFKEWGMGPSATDAPAAVVYMIYKGAGELDGKTYGAVIGVVEGQVQLSPMFASKKK
jgi:hypothetical protein